MKEKIYLALDLGASSGRGILGLFDGEKLRTQEIHRFDHSLCRLNGTTYWNILDLNRQCLNALSIASQKSSDLSGIGIDTWGLDYGLLDQNGQLMGNVISYRNSTEMAVKEAWKRISKQELFQTTGVGHLIFNTVYQLYERVLKKDPVLENAKTLLLLPDLISYFLTGEKGTEYTNACTTMLLNCSTGAWAQNILQRLNISSDLFTEVQMPGQLRGCLNQIVSEETGLKATPVYAVASHDTASAIASIPAKTEDFVYISSGTWSLIGIESDVPILSPEAFQAGYSNEGSLQGKFRLNRNIMGLGLIQECRKYWNNNGMNLSWNDIVAAAESSKPFQAFIDPDDVCFYDLQLIPEKIQKSCSARGWVPKTVGEIARCLYESLAMKYRYNMDQLEKISGRRFSVIHIVGGGSYNDLLNQFTANVTGCPVAAGPAEGASMANILTQAMAAGEINGIGQLREVINNSVDVRWFEPQDTAHWTDAYEKYRKLFLKNESEIQY